VGAPDEADDDGSEQRGFEGRQSKV
jgi:hypothetical protein